MSYFRYDLLHLTVQLTAWAIRLWRTHPTADPTINCYSIQMITHERNETHDLSCKIAKIRLSHFELEVFFTAEIAECAEIS